MSKKQQQKPKQVSKARIVDRLATLFGVDDITLIEPTIRRVLEVTELPIQGVMVVWKPLMPGSLNFTVIGIPIHDPTIIQDAARALRVIADDLSQRALNLALAPGDAPVGGEEEVVDGDNGDPPDGS